MTTDRRRRRHPAGASRILATGLATASTFGLVALLGSRAAATEVQASAAPAVPVTAAPTTTAPAPVIVIRRTHVPVDGLGAAPSSSSGASTRSAPVPARPAPPVTAAPRRSAPVTTSSAS